MPLPKHIAIIMDGNGRWAKAQDLPRMEGHRKGVLAAEEIITAARELKIPYLTLYAFSDENWRRPQEEIDVLMFLLKEFLISRQEKMLKNGIRFQTVGDVAKLPEEVQKTIDQTKEITKNGKDLTLILALSYGARNEIVRAVNSLLQVPVPKSRVPSPTITEDFFAQHLDTKDFPDPDLLIRTGGEIRISNFLLWQAAYAELYFTKTMWPDFTPADLKKAIEEFEKRERRFGKTSEQL